MRYLKVASVALNQIPLAFTHNKENILAALEQAKSDGVTVVCFPELCITGYGCEDGFLSPNVCKNAIKGLQELVPKTKNMIVAVGLPLLHQDAIYNTACLLVDGKIAGFVAKQHLANNGVYYEARWFKPWPAGIIETVSLDSGKENPDNLLDTYPIGDIVFNLNGLKVGFEICEDAWVAVRTGISLAKRDVDLILNPSASHFAFEKLKIRKRFIEEGARTFGVGYLYANLLGNEAGRLIYDGDTFILAADKWLAEGPRFSFRDFVVTSAILDVQNLRLQRSSIRNAQGINVPHRGSTWEESTTLKEEEFTRAVALGLFDYCRKSRSNGFALNLSGGADSSACACLVFLMVELAIQELGEEAFQKKMAYFFSEKEKIHKSYLISKLLICLYQTTQNNQESTWQSAKDLSEALGISLTKISIDGIISGYCELIRPIIQRDLNWQQDDIALQNIQARVRGPSIWLLANLRGSLILSTTNRSEAALGYFTMDGDSCGSISPIAGVDKSFILQWLRWLEKEGPVLIGPIPALKSVNALIPSAELRPPTLSQSDEADLMPFAWLDSIERLFVRDKCSPKEILFYLQREFPDEPLKKLASALERFFGAMGQKSVEKRTDRPRISSR